MLFTINSMFERFGELVVKGRYIFIAITLLIILASVFGLKNLRVGLDLDKYFNEDDPIIVNKQLFAEDFGNSDFVGVLVDADSVFDRDILKVIREVSRDLRDSVPFAKELISLTDINYVLPVNPMMPTKQSVFNTSDIDIDTISNEQLAKIVKLFDNRKGIKGKLYSADYKQTWIVLKLQNFPKNSEWKEKKMPIEFTGKIAYDIVQKYNKKYGEKYKNKHFKLTAAGAPVIAYRRNAETLQEMKVIIFFAAIVSVLLIILMTLSFRASMGVIISVAGSLLVVFGIKGYMQETVDSAFMLIPILLTIAVSVAYAIHFTAFYKKMLLETKDRRRAVVLSMKENGWPIFFASFTTIVSLMSFMTVPISPIQWAGKTAALSIFIVYIFLMFFYPSILSLGKNDKIKVRESKFDSKWNWLLDKISDIVLKHGKFIIIIFSLVTVVMSIFCFKVEVNLNSRKMFGTKMPHTQDMVYVSESKIATSYYYNILLKGNEKDFFRKLENVKKVAELDKMIEQSKIVSNVTCLTHKVGEMHQALRKDNPKFNRLPDSQTAYDALIKKLEGHSEKQMRAWVTSDYSTTQIFVEIPDFSSKPFVSHVDSVKAKISELFPQSQYPSFSSHFTGYAIQFAKMNQYVTLGLMYSFGLTLLIVFILMTVAFGSFRIGLVAMIPNILPVVFAGGVMGMLGMPLEFVTMTIAPMILGLAVDNTIHVINYSKLSYLQGNSYDDSVRNTFKVIGQAILKSSIILCFTLITFTFANMNNMINMGILTVLAIIVATMSDIFMTPTLIRLIKPFKRND